MDGKRAQDNGAFDFPDRAGSFMPGENAGFTEEAASSRSRKCPSCGNNLFFDPATGRLKCAHCGSEQTVFVLPCEKEDLDCLCSTNGAWMRETHIYHCSNCNAENVLPRREIAHVCPFCGSPSVAEKQEFSSVRPNAVLPFAVTREQAASAAAQWAKKRIFAPERFRSYFKPENMKGVYLPAFTFDANTFSSYEGLLGEDTYTTETDDEGNTTTQSSTDFIPIEGTYEYFLSDLVVHAGEPLPSEATGDLLSYDYENSVGYTEEFLYGFSALLNTRDGQSCWVDAQETARDILRSEILSQYRYDTVYRLNVDTQFFDVKYRCLLRPMYIGNYRYRGKSYAFYVNGRNGKTKGTAPVSPVKATFAGIGVAVLAALAVFLFCFL